MNDQQLDERLRAADPARTTSTSLSATIDQLVSQPTARRPRRFWRPVVAVGGALALVGALAAGTDLRAVLLSIPPFSELEHGATFRPADGLSYVPVQGPERGKHCELYIDLGGLTDLEKAEVLELWSTADSAAFAIAVQNRISTQDWESYLTPEGIEAWAAVDQILVDLETAVPGIEWGTAAPGQSFDQGDPHLAAVSRLCDDELNG